MAQPTLTQVHVSRALTNISVAYMQEADNFLATRVFPRVPVTNQANKYFVYSQADFYRSDAKRRGPGAQAARSGYNVDATGTYSCDRDALGHAIADPIRANADAPLDLDREATEYLSQQLLLVQETRFQGSFFKTGVWTGGTGGTDVTPTTKWDDAASTPIEDIRAQIRQVFSGTGYNPNKLVLGRKTFDNLLDHPDLIDRIKYGQTNMGPARANEEIMAQLFGVEEVIVANALQNTAIEGAAASYSFINDQKSALLVYAPANPGLMIPSGGYTFVWGGAEGADSGTGVRVKRYRAETEESDIVEAEMWYDQRLVAPTLGAFFTAAVS